MTSSKAKKAAPAVGTKRKANQQQSNQQPAKNGAEKRKKVDDTQVGAPTVEKNTTTNDIAIKEDHVNHSQQDQQAMDPAPVIIENQEQVLRRNEKLIVVKKQMEDSDIKWTSLEHRGVTFESRYEPHNVKLLYKGEPIEISEDIEEICNWWVQVDTTEFGEKEIVRQNFITSFLNLFDQSQGKMEFEDFDFRLIREQIEKQKEQRNTRTAEEKKQEQMQRQSQDKPYKFCLFDGQLEKISNHMVEPPGIFRGRGEHPHMGKFKRRVVPEQVSINIGQENPIPICNIPGHAWKRVVEKRDATWLAHFKDERSPFLLGKYVFLAAESSIKGQNDKLKYEKARRLKTSIVKIRENYIQKMHSNDLLDNQLGVCTYLIDKLALRVGNEKTEDEADTVGCCSLRVEHIKFEGEYKITFDFLGKDSMRYFNTVDVETIVYNLLQKFVSAKKPDADIFDMVNPTKLNDYLKDSMDDLSAKVFRTYNASVTLQEELQKGNFDDEQTSVEQKVKYYEDCNRKVAILCNHQKSVSKTHQASIEKSQALVEEKRQKLAKLNQLHKALKGGKALRGELKTFAAEKSAPKTVDSCLKKIKVLSEKIEKDEINIQKRDENKNVALGTSRINYMDPRITISWCKQAEVPIQKIFQATLQSKFAWAMDSEPVWKF